MPTDIVLGGITFVLAVLGGVASAHAPSKPRHKIIYLASFTLLGTAGVGFVVRQSRESATTEQRHGEALASITRLATESSRLEALNTKLQERVLQQSQMITNLSKATLAETTGGTSYGGLFPFILPFGSNSFVLRLEVIGKNPISFVTWRVVPGPQQLRPLQDVLADMESGRSSVGVSGAVPGILTPKHAYPIEYRVTPTKGAITTWTINVSARNGDVLEILEIRDDTEHARWQVRTTFTRDGKSLNKPQWEPS